MAPAADAPGGRPVLASIGLTVLLSCGFTVLLNIAVTALKTRRAANLAPVLVTPLSACSYRWC